MKPEAGELGLGVSGASAMSASLPTPNWRRSRTWALRAVGLLALVGCLSWTFYDVNWESLGQAMTKVRPGWLLLAAVVNFGVLFCQSGRWLALVRPLSSTATLGQAFKAMIVGSSVSTVVPARAGELARVQWLGRTTGIPRVAIVGSILLDQLVNAAGLLAGLAALPLILDVPRWMRPGGYLALALFVVGAIAVFAMRPAAAAPAVEDPQPGAAAPWRTFSGFVTRIRQGLVALRSPRALATSFGISLVAWFLEINVTALSMKAVGIERPITASILVLIAVNLALAVPFAPPGNVGTLELGAILALLEFGVPKEQALAFAICYHLLQVLPIGIIGFWLLSRGMSPEGRRSR